MYQIIGKKNLGEGINLYNISAPDIALKALPGQFIILRVNKNGERIPITIANSDKKDKTITILVQTLGKTTHLLSELNVGESLADLVGPLGVPTEIKKFGTVVCIGGGFGTAVIYPIAKAMKAEGNRVISIIGARSKEFFACRVRQGLSPGRPVREGLHGGQKKGYAFRSHRKSGTLCGGLRSKIRRYPHRNKSK